MQCVCEHCPVEMKDYRRGMLECPRGQEGANGALDLSRHGQSLIRSLASRGLGGRAGSPRSNPIPSTLSDDGFWAGYSLFSISPEVFGKPIVGALLAPSPHCTNHCRSPSESSPRSSSCEPAPIGDTPLHDLPSTLVAFLLATSLCCVCGACDRWCEWKHGHRISGFVHVCTPGSSVQCTG